MAAATGPRPGDEVAAVEAADGSAPDGSALSDGAPVDPLTAGALPDDPLPGGAGVVVGVVAALARYPLRSARGEDLERAHVTVGGLAGDRAHVLVDGDGRALRGRDAPALAGLVAALEGDRLVVRDADGLLLEAEGLAAATGVPGAGTARADDHGAAPGGAAVAPVHLVSVGAEAGPGAEGCDPDPRANVVLDLGPGPDPGAGPDAGAGAETWTSEGQGRPGPGAERGWVGAVLAVGGARLVVTRTPKRCLGVYADVLVAGEVAVGDVVRRLEGGAPTTA